MRNRIQLLLIPGALALTAGVAAAQPVPVPIPLPPPDGTTTPPPDGTPVPPPADGTTPPTDGTTPPADGTTATPPIAEEPPPEEPRVPPTDEVADDPVDEEVPERPRHALPELLLAPTGVMLPGGVLYARSGIDTSGGFSWDARFGLGDVAEFGVAMTDLIRGRTAYGEPTERLQPYPTATFRMGLSEDRLFKYQPALAIGFRKSFGFEEAGRRVETADLHFAGTLHLGKLFAGHLNVTAWDASVADVGEADPVLLHDLGLKKQLRVGGGIEVRAVDDADVMVDLAWIPEICYACTAPNRVKLRPVLSWGVRYDLTRWAQLQSGVRVPDIGSANLLDAEIFGQLTLVNSSLRKVVSRKRPTSRPLRRRDY